MAITILCPKCKATFTLEDASGDHALCPECTHFFALSAGRWSEVRNPETGITEAPGKHIAHQAGTRNDNDTSLNAEDRDVDHAILGIRLFSPVGWLGALILFFLPWVNVSCAGKTMMSMSGSQLAWGGATLHSEGKKLNVDDKQELENVQKEDWGLRRTTGSCLLTLYILGLAFALLFKVSYVRVPPSTARAMIGILCSVSLLLLLFSGSAVLLENPFIHPDREARGMIEIKVYYTFWYYVSYALNCWTLFSFVVEYSLLRKTRPSDSAYSQSAARDA
jgi:hypothetical protein